MLETLNSFRENYNDRKYENMETHSEHQDTLMNRTESWNITIMPGIIIMPALLFNNHRTSQGLCRNSANVLTYVRYSANYISKM